MFSKGSSRIMLERIAILLNSIMKILRCFFCIFYILSFCVFAQDEPIRVAVDGFTPPFVMQGGNNQLYGFDISMMEFICRTIQRKCTFTPVPFQDLFDDVESKKFDLAVSALTITAERGAKVNFSKPYLVSDARFISLTANAPKQFDLSFIQKKYVGAERATVFPAVIRALGTPTSNIYEFSDAPSMIDALQSGKIDLALMDQPSAMYWQSQSSGILIALGKPFEFGYGFGIAVNLEETDLLKKINDALMQYQNSEDFKRDYNKYIAVF